MDYSKALKVARALACLDQKELASLAGIDSSLVSLIENGKRQPSVTTLEKLARALEIPPHLFTLLAAEPDDLTDTDSAEMQKIFESLASLVINPIARVRHRNGESSSSEDA